MSSPEATDLAPIALFAFKRPEHTRKALASLAGNPEFSRSPLFIFCDGARRPDEAPQVEAVRALARDFPHPRKTLVEAPANLGLARSIEAGVGRLCQEFGRVIVIEDDLLVSPVFLDYMNQALRRYANDERVFQITGHMWPIGVSGQQQAYFLPLTNSLGWGTWQRAWAHYDSAASAWPSIEGDRQRRKAFDLGGKFPFSAMMRKQLQGKIDSWAIRWYLAVFLRKGLVLHPASSLIVNIGFDGAGTHSKKADQERYGFTYSEAQVKDFPEVLMNDSVFGATAKFLARQNSPIRRIRAKIRSVFEG